jgi:hypothetical protein
MRRSGVRISSQAPVQRDSRSRRAEGSDRSSRHRPEPPSSRAETVPRAAGICLTGRTQNRPAGSLCPQKALGTNVAKRKSGHAKGGLGRYSPPTRRRGTHAAVNAESDRHRVHPAVTLTGAGLLATTGLFGLGMLASSTSGAVAAPASVPAGPSSTVGDTVNDGSTGTSSNDVPFVGSQNTGNDQTANGNSPVTTSDETPYVGSFGIGSKTTQISTQATVIQWRVLQGLITFTGRLTCADDIPYCDDEPIEGATITFTMSGQYGKSCQAITNAAGNAECQVTVNPLFALPPRPSYTASYDGSSLFAPSSATGFVQYH